MKKEIEQTVWGRSIPWILTIACLATLIIIGKFLIDNIDWYKDGVFTPCLDRAQTPIYRIHAYHMHMSMIKRSVGLFSGFAIMFLGLGVAFFSLKQKTDINVNSKVWAARVATASPGIVALLLGATIIMYTIASKDNFASFPVVYENVNNHIINKELKNTANEKQKDSNNQKPDPIPKQNRE